MTAAARTESTAVARRVDSRVAELKERNALVAAIRGTQWGRDTTPEMQRAVAHYCHENGLDPVRHVEILGGRIYLTASFYEERGAPLLRSGAVKKDVPDFIQADARLDKLAADGDQWAQQELTRRLRLRIQHGVPDAAAAACVQRFTLEDGGMIVGVNWCGGTGRRDPVGDAEPTKTAETRAARRAWKQIADVIPGYGEMVRPVEASARVVSESLPVSVVDAPRGPRALVGSGDPDPYAAAGTTREKTEREVTEWEASVKANPPRRVTDFADELPEPPAKHSDDPALRAEDVEAATGELPLDDPRPARRRNAQLD